MKKTILYFIGVIALFASCSKVSGPVTPDLTSISLGRDTLTLTVGNSFQLNIKLTPTDYNKSLISLKASDTTVITVSKSGMVTAKKPGIAIITAANNKQTISVTCLVTVISKPVIDSLKIGLLVYFPFNNSGVDSSGNGNNGMINEITSVPNRFGTANSAYYFNGLTSYVRVKDNQSLRLSNTDITLNAWIKLDSYNSSFGDNLLSKHLTGADQGWAWGITGYSFSPTGIITYGPGGGSASARGSILVGQNQWHMVTSVYDLINQRLTIYVDGVIDNVTNGIPSPNSSINADMYVGRDNPEVPTNGYFVKGAIDEVRIYKRKLNISEIHRLFVSAK